MISFVAFTDSQVARKGERRLVAKPPDEEDVRGGPASSSASSTCFLADDANVRSALCLAIVSSVEMIHPTCCSNEWMRVLKLAKSHNKPNPGTNEMT